MDPNTPEIAVETPPEPPAESAVQRKPAPAALDPLERVGLVLFALVLAGLVYILPVVMEIFAAQKQEAAAKAAEKATPAVTAPAAPKQ